MSQLSGAALQSQEEDASRNNVDLQRQLADANRYKHETLETKYHALRREHAEKEIQIRLLRSEVADINVASTAIEDRMYDQYYESLDLKMLNAELKERNAWLEREVLRLKGNKEEEVDTKEKEEAKHKPKGWEEKTKAAHTRQRTCEKVATPARSVAKVSGSKKITAHYCQPTASSKARSTSHSSTIKASPDSISRSNARPQSFTSSKKRISSPSSPFRSLTPTPGKGAALRVTVEEISETVEGDVGSSNASTPRTTSKRILSPRLRQMVQRIVSRSPEPEGSIVDLLDYPMKLEVGENTKKDEAEGVRGDHNDEQKEAKRGGIKSTAFI